MNKKDLIPVILLALLIPAWIFIDRTFIAPRMPAAAPAPVEQAQETAPSTSAIETDAISAAQDAKAAIPATAEKVAAAPAEEKIILLQNDKIRLELTSLGGGIKSATLLDYPELNEEGSDPVKIDFSAAPALAYMGLPGIGAESALQSRMLDDGKTVEFSKAIDDIAFVRTITLGDGYLLDVSDRFINNTGEAWTVPGLRILTGRMENPADTAAMKGMSILGADSYTPAGGVNYWGRKLNKLFKDAGKPEMLDAVPEEMRGQPVDWVSAKNKFFTQILRPAEPVATMAVLATRDPAEKGILPVDIAAALDFRPEVLGDAATHGMDYTYYIGPKKYSVLKDSGYHMEKVMEFETIGGWSFMNWLMEPARKFLLHTMNLFKSVIPGGYGVAIILLTVLIRILFWPLTHKSTESMKRMQEIQPEIKALQEKYKKEPQRLQQETMKLYKEKKVNPMGGCLPMFVQIPVFFALFTVLRNAIELRYAGFLWIDDLSMAENLFAGSVPFVGSLNILPLLMSASMIWQQKLTSPATAATPEQQQQQKMMMVMMPIMMLFFFYKMPSGLVLYWTTSNLLMIAQTAIRNLRKKKDA
jgi:YidC/Oxa1 family membrane protein insertase